MFPRRCEECDETCIVGGGETRYCAECGGAAHGYCADSWTHDEAGESICFGCAEAEIARKAALYTGPRLVVPNSPPPYALGALDAARGDK